MFLTCFPGIIKTYFLEYSSRVSIFPVDEFCVLSFIRKKKYISHDIIPFASFSK